MVFCLRRKGVCFHMKYLFYSQTEPFLVKDLAESWLLNIKDTIKPSAYARYKKYAGKYILPYVGNMQADVFDKTALSAVLALLRSGHSQTEPLSQYTVYFVDSMVRAMFSYGAEKHLVPEISFGESEYKIQDKKYAMPLTELQIMQLVHMVEQQELDVQAQIILPLYTGLSLSELCSLKWEDIDMENNRIHVRRKLMRIKRKSKVKENNHSDNSAVKNNKGSKNKSTVLVECELPETSCRDFMMPEKVHALLEAIITMKNPVKKRYVAEITSAEFSEVDVEANKNKKVLPPDAGILQCRLKKIGKEAEIPELTYHMLRDTFAVMSLHAGGDIYNVSCVMGISVNDACERYGPWLVMNDGFMKKML